MSIPCLSISATEHVAAVTPFAAGQTMSELAAARDFSVAKNPYLFPRHLLDPNAEIEVPARWKTPGVSDPLCWWLAHTKPRQEKKLAGELEVRGIAHYLPVQERRSLTRGKTRTSLVPNFPGYMFFLGNKSQRISVLETGRLVAAHPIADGDAIQARLCELADLIERGAELNVESLLVPGRKFRVRSGVFKGKEGKVIKRGGKTRLFVFINEILGGVSMEIEDHLLEPI